MARQYYIYRLRVESGTRERNVRVGIRNNARTGRLPETEIDERFSLSLHARRLAETSSSSPLPSPGSFLSGAEWNVMTQDRRRDATRYVAVMNSLVAAQQPGTSARRDPDARARTLFLCSRKVLAGGGRGGASYNADIYFRSRSGGKSYDAVREVPVTNARA